MLVRSGPLLSPEARAAPELLLPEALLALSTAPEGVVVQRGMPETEALDHLFQPQSDQLLAQMVLAAVAVAAARLEIS